MGFMYRIITRVPSWTVLAAAPFGIVWTLRTCRHYYGVSDDVSDSKHVISKPFGIYNAGRIELSEHLRVVPYGVLGTQLTVDKQIVAKADPPEDVKVVIVDPAGLHHIQDTPQGAGGAAGAIYRWIGNEWLPQDKPFPKIVRDEITIPTHASRYVYGGKAVIHAVGPDLRTDEYSGADTQEAFMKAKRDLTLTYANILKQFAEHLEPEITNWRHDALDYNERRPFATLRMLPVSGGIFSGTFKQHMPQLTVESIVGAFETLPKEYRRALAKRTRAIELCIFDENEYGAFRSAAEQIKRNLQLSKVTFDDALTAQPWRLQNPESFRVIRSSVEAPK